jgi:hypothetical protein
MSNGRGPVAVALAFFAAACVAAFAIGTPPRSPRGEDALGAFLETWRDSRVATFVVDSDFTRTLPNGNVLPQTQRIVQRPPGDRLTIGFGAISGRLDGKIVRCASEPSGTSQCFTAEAAGDYVAEVDAQITGFDALVRGYRPAYSVIEFTDRANRCFRLDLAIDFPSPPYGDHALFCFDTATLAPSLTVIERSEATDRTEATAIRPTVTAEDLDVAVDPGELPATPGATSSSTSS